jgi:CheY-like chemotaxis protein
MARILVIEKDAAVRRLLMLQLGRLGHEPIVDRAGSPIDLAVVEPNGPGAFDAARALARRAVPLVFVSTEPRSRSTDAIEPKAHLVKPFTRAQLQQAVAQALAQRAPDAPVSEASSAATETGFGRKASGATTAASSRA